MLSEKHSSVFTISLVDEEEKKKKKEEEEEVPFKFAASCCANLENIQRNKK